MQKLPFHHKRYTADRSKPWQTISVCVCILVLLVIAIISIKCICEVSAGFILALQVFNLPRSVSFAVGL